ncbi:MAG: hypothetical protein JNK87_28880 [Bryobacterales bacterium]|nr:hypothetical protein [Bryobacterales bacterium]
MQLLVLDEPLAGLDAGSAREIVALLVSLQQQRGSAMLLISHDLTSLASFAGRVQVMAHGRIVEEREGPTFLESATHPESLALLAAMLPEAQP